MSPWARKALIRYADQISLINVTRTEDAGSDKTVKLSRPMPRYAFCL